MCWKYEHEYGECMDLIYKDVFWQDKDGLDSLLRRWGIDIVKDKHEEYEKLFCEFLTACHEKHIFIKAKEFHGVLDEN